MPAVLSCSPRTRLPPTHTSSPRPKRAAVTKARTSDADLDTPGQVADATLSLSNGSEPRPDMLPGSLRQDLLISRIPLSRFADAKSQSIATAPSPAFSSRISRRGPCGAPTARTPNIWHASASPVPNGKDVSRRPFTASVGITSSNVLWSAKRSRRRRTPCAARLPSATRARCRAGAALIAPSRHARSSGTAELRTSRNTCPAGWLQSVGITRIGLITSPSAEASSASSMRSRGKYSTRRSKGKRPCA